MTYLKYEEICLYCKTYDIKKRQCRGRDCAPTEKPEDKKCYYFRKSDDAKFCFAENNTGINDKLPTEWSNYKREKLKDMYYKILRGDK